MVSNSSIHLNTRNTVLSSIGVRVIAGKVLELETLLVPDNLGCEIARNYLTWENFRAAKVREWEEIQRYIFATDTTKTTNSKLPWSNKTTIPKLCQIRDNLHANYIASMFPKRCWMKWEGDEEPDEIGTKVKSIESYMAWVVDRNEFYDEMVKAIYDYIDYGNVFVMPEWIDKTQTGFKTIKERVGYVGPVFRRISPLDIVFNPTAPSFLEAPKIIRSYVSIGEIAEMVEASSFPEDQREDARNLLTYMKELRTSVAQFSGTVITKDSLYDIQGFDSYSNYLAYSTVEVLTFYGDIYDTQNDKYYRNYEIKVVDRHKILCKRSNASYFGMAPIYHAGWRVRPDNLWAMGPLDNLIGMQYRIDHLENLKADIFDLSAFPVLKIKGHVEDFDWGPFERIYCGDNGDVVPINIDPQILSAETQIKELEAKMEEMAGSPREAAGFRTPGEKTMYEVQRLELAAGRIFQNKINQFERQITENILNAMLELARRMIDKTTIRVFDNDLKIADFRVVSAEDIAGSGRIKPVAARHFAERALKVQDLNNFFNSHAGNDQQVLQHFSTIKLAKMWEELLNLEDDQIVLPFVRISEQADAAKMVHSAQQDVSMVSSTPTNHLPGDADPTKLGETQ